MALFALSITVDYLRKQFDFDNDAVRTDFDFFFNVFYIFIEDLTKRKAFS